MDGFELIFLVVAFLAGFFIVSAIWPKQRAAQAQHARARAPYDRPSAADDTRPWHEVLAVSPTASLDDIKQAYRVQIGKHHPDKVAQMGPELQQLASDMSKRINRAYETALRERS